MEGWPDRQRPIVNAIWKMNRTNPEKSVSIAELQSAGKQAVRIPDWPDGSIELKAEWLPAPDRRLFLTLTKLSPVPRTKEAAASESASIADIRVEVGTMVESDSRFQPNDRDWNSEYIAKHDQIKYWFNVERKDATHIGLTSLKKREENAIKLEKPLKINKWDDEQ